MTEPTDQAASPPDLRPHFHAASDANLARREERLLAHNRDVAQLARMTERLVHWAAVIESSDDAIFGKTLDGIITSWNYGAERLYGYAPEEIVGRSVAVLFPSDRPDEFDRIMTRLRRGERIDHYETVRVRKDGSSVDVSVTISPIRDPGGALIGVASIGRDITERKRLEQRRLAFAVAASHELKTPLTVQRIAVQALRRAVERGNMAALPRLLDRIEDGLSRQARLVDGLLEASRLERGALVARPTRFALDDLVRDTADQLRGLSHHDFLVAAPAPVEVVADRDQVGQVLVNLLANAVKYSPAADRVEIAVAADGWATVAVRDYGVGLAPVDQERVFEPFVRVEGEATAALSGMGLGLYLASQLTALQGGRLRVESAAGKGATFTLDLPLPPDAGQGRHSPAAPPRA